MIIDKRFVGIQGFALKPYIGDRYFIIVSIKFGEFGDPRI